MAKKIMAWSKCKFKIGKTGTDDAMATTLTSIGTIKDKSSTLEPTDGDVLEAKASGGETVAKETQEGGFLLKTRVIEPEDDLLTMLGLGEVDTTSQEFRMKTHVVEGDFSVEVEPKNYGAKGIRAPKTNVAYKPGWSEEEGNYADLEFEIVKTDKTDETKNYWYSRYTKTKPTEAG